MSGTTTGEKSKPRLSLTDVAELAATTKPPPYWVDGVMVGGQPLVIGGPAKSLKTSIALDLAVSLGTGTKFLGLFPVPKARRVAVFSGESGRATVNETIGRILRSKGRDAEDCLVSCGFRLPRLSRAGDRAEMGRLLERERVEAVVIDPLYMCLLAGGRPLSAANLYDVGAVLGDAADACRRAGATLVLVHHTNKGAAARPAATTLHDLSFTGVGEFARQWLLLGRPGEYTPGSGVHDLTLSVGGSAGHSSQWRVRVNEGTAGDRGGRRWAVTVDDDRPSAYRSGPGSCRGISRIPDVDDK